MAKSPQNRPQGQKPINPTAGIDKVSDDWKDDEVEREVKKADEETRAKIDAQTKVSKEADSLKAGFFEKAVDAVKHALHLDEPKHLHHSTGDLHPEEAERVKEAHKVNLGDGADFKGVSINKVPGKLRKFMDQK